MSINFHHYDQIENSNNRILHYKSGVKISTLRISFRRYNYKIGLLLDFSAASNGGPCSIFTFIVQISLFVLKKI